PPPSPYPTPFRSPHAHGPRHLADPRLSCRGTDTPGYHPRRHPARTFLSPLSGVGMWWAGNRRAGPHRRGRPTRHRHRPHPVRGTVRPGPLGQPTSPPGMVGGDPPLDAALRPRPAPHHLQWPHPVTAAHLARSGTQQPPPNLLRRPRCRRTRTHAPPPPLLPSRRGIPLGTSCPHASKGPVPRHRLQHLYRLSPGRIPTSHVPHRDR